MIRSVQEWGGVVMLYVAAKLWMDDPDSEEYYDILAPMVTDVTIKALQALLESLEGVRSSVVGSGVQSSIDERVVLVRKVLRSKIVDAMRVYCGKLVDYAIEEGVAYPSNLELAIRLYKRESSQFHGEIVIVSAEKEFPEVVALYRDAINRIRELKQRMNWYPHRDEVYESIGNLVGELEVEFTKLVHRLAADIVCNTQRNNDPHV